jgi:hypothetical protein
MNPEHLKNTLLVTLVVMLVYVLYKRLIHILRKDQVKAKYPALPNQLVWSPDGTEASIELQLAVKMYLIVEIFDERGSLQSHIAEGEYDAGPHRFSFTRAALSPGRYYYRITSPHEQASQYFVI